MKLAMIKRPDGLLECSTELDYLKVAKMGTGEMLEMHATKIRDRVNHCRYFVMHEIYFENQEEYVDPWVARKSVEMEAGFREEVVLYWKGEQIKSKWPKSIAYDKLDETGFQSLKERCGDVIVRRLNMGDMIDWEVKDICEQILQLSNWHGLQ